MLYSIYWSSFPISIIEKIPKEISGNTGEKNFPGNSRKIPGKILQ